MPPSTTDPRARLLARRHELLQELEEAWDAQRSAVEADASGVHDSKDEADRSAAAGRRHAEASRDAAELRAVQEALRRLDAGTYGRCVGCGESIDPRRLEVEPDAAYCTGCQAAQERTARR